MPKSVPTATTATSSATSSNTNSLRRKRSYLMNGKREAYQTTLTAYVCTIQ